MDRVPRRNAHCLFRSLDLARNCLVAKTRKSAHLEDRFDELLERIHSQPTRNSILLSMHGAALVAEVIENTSVPAEAASKPSAPESGGVEDDLVARARELIWTQSHRRLSVRQIARKLSVTRRMLERRFRAATGDSTLQDIVQCRFSLEKRLLLETDLPTKTIAYLAGFASDEQMRVTFKRLAGRSPGEYRRTGELQGPETRRSLGGRKPGASESGQGRSENRS